MLKEDNYRIIPDKVLKYSILLFDLILIIIPTIVIFILGNTTGRYVFIFLFLFFGYSVTVPNLRTFEINKDGIFISFLFFKRRVTWNQIKTFKVINASYQLKKVNRSKYSLILSTRPGWLVKIPFFLSPEIYEGITFAFSTVHLYFEPIEHESPLYKSYFVNGYEFLTLLEGYGLRIENKELYYIEKNESQDDIVNYDEVDEITVEYPNKKNKIVVKLGIAMIYLTIGNIFVLYVIERIFNFQIYSFLSIMILSLIICLIKIASLCKKMAIFHYKAVLNQDGMYLEIDKNFYRWNQLKTVKYVKPRQIELKEHQGCLGYIILSTESTRYLSDWTNLEKHFTSQYFNRQNSYVLYVNDGKPVNEGEIDMNLIIQKFDLWGIKIENIELFYK